MQHIKNALVERDWTKYEIVLGYDDNPHDPRECTGWSILCFRKHRRMDFPNEADFDFDRFDDIIGSSDPEDRKELTEMFKFDGPGHVFWIDCYEHSVFAFSLSWIGTQCRFDTSRNAGFIFVNEPDLEKARAIAEDQLSVYEDYVNGNAYVIDVYKTTPLFRKDGTESDLYETEYLEPHAFYPDGKDCLPDWILEAFNDTL